MTASCNYMRKFSEHLFYRVPPGNFLFHVEVAEFQPEDAVKNHFTGAFQAFIKEREVAVRRRSFT